METTISDTSRIVTLNGDLNEIVYVLGYGEAVVGNDLSATFPPETIDLPKVGYQRALNAEGILSLDPTLVIGNEQAGPPQVLEQVRDAGVPVVILADETSIDGAARKVVMVGAVLGARDRAAELAEQIGAEIAGARELIPDRTPMPRIAFIYARGLGILFLAGRDTSSESLITAAGGVDAGAEAGVTDFAPLTAEGLAAADPDWLILTEDGLKSVGGLDGLLAIPGVAQTAAGRERRVLTFDDLGFLGLTPRVGTVLRSLILSLYEGQ
ncbi:MAG: ABC transporter substrate-binding protein [Acidimicrobiia bacterium]|nr:ABC transporter substrate-binding protein [Acidimicrobiia bacterium]